MPLQIRRGTTAQRLSITPLIGEPIYDTELQTVFVGDGITPGGVSAITGLTNEDVVDAVGAALEAGQHENIIFTYTGLPDAADRIDARVDLSDYTGEIKASNFRGPLFADDSSIIIDSATSFITAANVSAAVITSPNFVGSLLGDIKGSVFGDDSIALVNAVDSSINLDGTVKGNIIPDVNIAYDIGSNSLRFKDLWLSGTTIHLGNATITASGSAVELPAGSTVAGVPIGSGGSGDGVVSEGEYRINIIGLDSTRIIDLDQTTVTAFTGNFDKIYSGDIEPTANGLYDIGTSTVKYKDLHLSSRVYLGSAILNAVGSTLELPVNSTAGGAQILVAGTPINNNIVADDLTTIVNVTTKDIVAHTITADLTGSVFADDSSILIDATQGIISTGKIFLEQNTFYINDQFIDIGHTDPTQPCTFRFYQPNTTVMTEFNGITNGTYGLSEIVKICTNDTFNPQTVAIGDVLYGLGVVAHDGTDYRLAGGLQFLADPNVVSWNPNSVAGAVRIGVWDDNIEGNINKSIFLDSRGWVGILNGINQPEATLDVNGFAKLAILSAAPAVPANGMVAIADGDSVSGWDPLGLGAPAKQQMVVYLGGGWRQIAVEP